MYACSKSPNMGQREVMMPMGWCFRVLESLEWFLPDVTPANGCETWSVTLLVSIASTSGLVRWPDGNPNHKTGKAPNEHSIRKEHVHMQKQSLNATIQIDISTT